MLKSLEDLEEELCTRIEELLSSGLLIAIKAEFEAEGTRIDELAILSELCCKFKVPLTLKVGGPSAQRDFYEAFQLCADKILVPMVESEFSLSKSLAIYSSFIKLFKDLDNNPKLSFNVETALTTKNIDSILEAIFRNNYPISEIVIGRSDLSQSLDIKDVNDDEIFTFTKSLLNKLDESIVKVNVGGNLGTSSYSFIKKLSNYGLSSFESRKCTFKCKNDLTKSEFEEIIKQSLEFEMSWLNYKKKLYSDRSEEENIRIKTISKRLEV